MTSPVGVAFISQSWGGKGNRFRSWGLGVAGPGPRGRGPALAWGCVPGGVGYIGCGERGVGWGGWGLGVAPIAVAGLVVVLRAASAGVARAVVLRAASAGVARVVVLR